MILVKVLIVLLVILMLHHFYYVIFKKKTIEGLESATPAAAAPAKYKEIPGLERDPVYLSITNASNISVLKSQLDDLIGIKQTVNDLSAKVEQNTTAIADLGQSLNTTSQQLLGTTKEQSEGKGAPLPQVTGME